MKTLFKYLSAVALALVLFVPAKTALSDGFPAGVSFSHIVGSVLDPSTAANPGVDRNDSIYTTLDAVNFGFMTKYVRICLRAESEDVYFRLNTSVNTGTLGGGTNLLLWELASTANFINGNASFDFGALPMTAPTSNGVLGIGSSAAVLPLCITQPWRTRGIVMHIASGMATADVWGYR